MASSSRVTIFTDGACKGNPGRGGWAAVLMYDGEQRVLSGREPRTTNNRMELMAAIQGLEAAERFEEIVLYADSMYLINTMTKGWKRNANLDLWERLDRLVQGRKVTWKWVRGHNGTPGNELADSIASQEAGLIGAGLKSEPTVKKKPQASTSPASSEQRRRRRRGL